MIEINFENIAIKHLGSSSGLFIGNTNTIKSFRHKKEVNEVLGVLSGDENKLIQNKWMKTNENSEGQ